MLLAAVSSGGPQALRPALAAICERTGAPSMQLETRGGFLGAWSPGTVDVSRAQAVEGWIDFEGNASLATLAIARGDFVRMSLEGGDLLVGSGPAGGSRPIYIARPTPDTVFACSRLAPLLAVMPVRPELNADFLAANIALDGPFPPTATPYAGIQRVPMGEAWLLRSDGQDQRSSTVRAMNEPELRASAGDLATQFRDALEAAVLNATHGAAGVAVAVSGGLDSSALMALLCKLRRRGTLNVAPKAYALDFDAPLWGDDRPHRASLETSLGVRIARITAEGSPPFSLTGFVADAAPCWSATTSLAIELGRRAVTDGADTVLTGVGGDDVADGQPILFADLARQGHPVEAVRALLRLRGLIGFTPRRRIRDLLLRPLARPFFPSTVSAATRRKSIALRYPWAGPRLRRHLDELVARPYSRPSLDESPDHRYRRLLSLPVFSMTRMARVQEESQGGHTRRDPFLDDDFLRFVARIPPLSLMQNDFCRGLLRDAMRGLLPESLRLRETKAPLEPACARMVDVAGGFRILEGLASTPMLADLQLVEPKAFRRRFDEIAAQPLQSGWPQLWAVLATEAFIAHEARDGVMPPR